MQSLTRSVVNSPRAVGWEEKINVWVETTVQLLEQSEPLFPMTLEV